MFPGFVCLSVGLSVSRINSNNINNDNNNMHISSLPNVVTSEVVKLVDLEILYW